MRVHALLLAGRQRRDPVCLCRVLNQNPVPEESCPRQKGLVQLSGRCGGLSAPASLDPAPDLSGHVACRWTLCGLCMDARMLQAVTHGPRCSGHVAVRSQVRR